jgi:hypothetical protein
MHTFDHARVSQLSGSGVAGPCVEVDLTAAVLAWLDGGNFCFGELAAEPGEHVCG